MRNSRSCSTPKTNVVKDDKLSDTTEKGSAKKLKQARLPFKIIAPGTSSVDSKTPTTSKVEDTEDLSADLRKRKLSYESDGDCMNVIVKKDDNVSKENVDILTSGTKKQKLSTVSINDAVLECVVSLLDDVNDPDEEANTEIVKNCSLASGTPKASGKDKRKGAGTPQTSSAQKDKNGSATKLQIKLPLSAGKKKRRKSNLQKTSPVESEVNNLTQEISSDDIEGIAAELNPHKRKKLNTDYDKIDKPKTKTTVLPEKEIETITLDSEPEKENENKSFEQEKSPKTCKIEETTINLLDKSSKNNNDKNVQDSSDDEEKQKVEEDMEDSVLSDNDNEADDETDNLTRKSIRVSSNANKNLKSKPKDTEQLLSDKKSSVSSSKNLTPKQLKLTEQRRKAREEKERKLQEEKLKKQQEKEEKEIVKKREREEKEEQKRKEREEKDEQKRKEREEKERKRLAEIEAKNEEKRKRNEAKEEELRKKEEERKRKEQEKEEAELKKKKAAQAFTKFFVAKTPTNTQLKNEDDSNTGDGSKILAFRPFQIKGDMKLAPICRKNLTADEKARLDDLLNFNNQIDMEENVEKSENFPKSKLYLSELRSGKILPGKWRRPSTESKDDVILVEDELERVGQEIVEDIPAYVREEMRVKFYKFHDNRRPPYYGTWRKKSSVVKPRRPFAQDKKFFDYEIDSDDEWEEEEPGESLEDGSDEDKEKESEDDEYEVDNEWFVPHGHLSDEELQNEDEFGIGDDNTREAQKAKLQILQQEFAQEMKKKTEKIKPRLIGCIWADQNGSQPSNCAKILWDTLEKKAMLFTDAPLIEEPEADKSNEPSSPSGGTTNGNTEKGTDKLKPISLSDNMVKDLTRLVHGNNHAKNFLINEYIAYVEKTEESVRNGGWRKPLKSVVRDKIDEIAEWQAVDATASSIQEIEQTNDETNDKKKKKVKRRLCWVVKQEMLDKMDLSTLKLKNSWKYTLPPKLLKTDKVKTYEAAATLNNVNLLDSTVEAIKGKNSEASQITKYTKVLTTEKETTNQQITSLADDKNSHDKSISETNSNVTSITKEKKRVPLLMSVARDQQISTPAKNKLISQFLQHKNKDSVKTPSPTTRRSNAITLPNVEDDNVVILD